MIAVGIKPTVKPMGGINPGNSDQRLTTCKVCGFGIFHHEPRQWSQKPLGLVHTRCAPKEATR